MIWASCDLTATFHSFFGAGLESCARVLCRICLPLVQNDAVVMVLCQSWGAVQAFLPPLAACIFRRGVTSGRSDAHGLFLDIFLVG